MGQAAQSGPSEHGNTTPDKGPPYGEQTELDFQVQNQPRAAYIVWQDSTCPNPTMSQLDNVRVGVCGG